jgi:hypothetical protein
MMKLSNWTGAVLQKQVYRKEAVEKQARNES